MGDAAIVQAHLLFRDISLLGGCLPSPVNLPAIKSRPLDVLALVAHRKSANHSPGRMIIRAEVVGEDRLAVHSKW